MNVRTSVILIFVACMYFSGCNYQAEEYIKMGVSKADLKDYESAIEYYDKAIEIDPKNPQVYNYRGLSKYYKGQTIARMEEFIGSIESRGFEKYLLREFIDAIEDYNKAIQLNPKYLEAYLNRGNSKLALKDYRGGIVDYDKVIELDSQNVDAYLKRGISKSSLKNYTSAIIDYDKTIELDSKNAEAYYNRGILKKEVNNFNEACLDLSKAGELGYEEAYNQIREHCN